MEACSKGSHGAYVVHGEFIFKGDRLCISSCSIRELLVREAQWWRTCWSLWDEQHFDYSLRAFLLAKDARRCSRCYLTLYYMSKVQEHFSPRFVHSTWYDSWCKIHLVEALWCSLVAFLYERLTLYVILNESWLKERFFIVSLMKSRVCWCVSSKQLNW